MRLTGALDPAALTAAVREIARRHETLRTTFPAVAGKAAQVIAPPAAAESLRVPLVDLGALPPERREAELARIGDLDARLPFDLAQGPLLRLALVRLAAAADDHVLLLAMHHIISDGWSIGVFVRELAALYEASGRAARRRCRRCRSSTPTSRSGSAAGSPARAWSASSPGGGSASRARPRRSTCRPTGRAASRRARGRPTARSPCRESWAAPCAPSPRAAGATPFIVLLAAFDTLLARWARQEDVSVGTPIANRTRRRSTA